MIFEDLLSDFGLNLIPTITFGELATFLVLLLTFLAGTLYAIYTRGLWVESIRQTDLAIAPLLAIHHEYKIDKTTNPGRVFILKNIGKGPAYDIEIEDFYLNLYHEKFSKKVETYKLHFDKINYLEAGQSISLKVKCTVGDEELSEGSAGLYAAFLGPHAPGSTPMFITYRDCLGGKIYVEIIFGKGNFKIRTISKKIAAAFFLKRYFRAIKGKISTFIFVCGEEKKRKKQKSAISKNPKA